MPSLKLDLTTCSPTDSQMTFEMEIVTPHGREEVGSEDLSYLSKSTKMYSNGLRLQSVLGRGTGSHNLRSADGHICPREGQSQGTRYRLIRDSEKKSQSQSIAKHLDNT